MALTEEQFNRLKELNTKYTGQVQMQDVNEQGVVGLKGIGTGLAKSGLSLLRGAGEFGQDIAQATAGRVIESLTGSDRQSLGTDIYDPESVVGSKVKESLQPKGTAEKIGSFVGDVASYVLPGSAAMKATKGASFLTKAAVLGASDATMTTIRQGEFNRESVDSAIISSVFPFAGKGLTTLKTSLLGKNAGAKVINSLIKPLLKDFSYGKNPGRAVAESGIVANNLDDLAIGIRNARQDIGEQISEKIANTKTVYSVNDSMAALDDAIKEAQKSPRTNSAIINRLQNLKDDLLVVGEDGLPTRKLDNLTAQEVFEIKKEVGDLTRWTGNASDDEIVNKALKNVYGNLKSKLDKTIPEIKELNEKYADLKSAEIATIYRDKIAARQNLISFSGTQLGTAAAVTSAVVSGGAVAPILIGATAAAGTEALKSPAVKTRVAAWLANASRNEIKDAFTQAPWLRGAIQASLFGEDEVD